MNGKGPATGGGKTWGQKVDKKELLPGLHAPSEATRPIPIGRNTHRKVQVPSGCFGQRRAALRPPPSGGGLGLRVTAQGATARNIDCEVAPACGDERRIVNHGYRIGPVRGRVENSWSWQGPSNAYFEGPFACFWGRAPRGKLRLGRRGVQVGADTPPGLAQGADAGRASHAAPTRFLALRVSPARRRRAALTPHGPPERRPPWLPSPAGDGGVVHKFRPQGGGEMRRCAQLMVEKPVHFRWTKIVANSACGG